MMEFFGLTTADVPDYRIIKMQENMAKFRPDTKDLSTEAVVKFTKDVVSGTATVGYLQSLLQGYYPSCIVE